MSRRNYLICIFISVCALWGLSFFHVHSPANWLAESRIFFWTLPLAAAIAAYVRMSKLSLTFIGIYLTLHIMGMHFNYGEVPFGRMLGHLLGTDRNMYDRFVHFMFGLLMFYPIREILLATRKTFGFFNYLLPVVFVSAFSALYEIMEWHTVSGLSTSVGYLFIGGSDPFDSEKDMACAIIGAVVALAIVLATDAFRARRLSKSGLRIE